MGFVYHNHKELMVNAGFVIQLTLFATIIMENVWPPKWIEGDSIFNHFSTSIIYSIFWLIIHLFIVWQLQNKIAAALFINGYSNALKKLIFNGIEKQDLILDQEERNPSKLSFCYKISYHIFPQKYHITFSRKNIKVKDMI